MPRPALPSPLRLALAALVLMLLALAGCASLDERQRAWIFQPSDRTWSGGLAAAQGMDDVWIDFDSRETGERARLHGLWLPQASDDAPLLLYLHGARWDVRGSAHRMRRMHELGFAVLGVDYRGFGQSSAALPSETMAYEDARAAWDWLAAQHPGRQRFVFGHSLGGAIAVHLAAEAPEVAGLMVEGSFPSIPEVVSRFKWGWLPVGPLITQRFEAGERIARVRAPVLVVHGSEDRLIPHDLGRALFDRAAEPKRFVLVEGGSHHNTNAVGLSQYRDAVGQLFGVGAARDAMR
ncbi:alpha/beta hydrolase [Ideonella sp. A 288]|uniref:alpha/beta hydrolase n=1 Tax=Ideonella sp. A 288 TaxID=1962181 RepID=UPI000B4AC79E|nr:alpha/beta fold hydrolase [Ideonella sp. A 288]